MPPTSPLFVMDITYNAHLGLYNGQPQAVDQSGSAPQQIYATDNLAEQKWFLLGDGHVHQRLVVPLVPRRGEQDELRDRRQGLPVLLFLRPLGRLLQRVHRPHRRHLRGRRARRHHPGLPDLLRGRPRPRPGLRRLVHHFPGVGHGSGLESWIFTSDGDGSYRVANAGTGHLLGVGSTSTTTRAWGTRPTVTAAGSGGPTVGQQWFVVPGTSATDGGPTGTYKIVNRYSGPVIGMSGAAGRLAETTPTRSWSDTTGGPVGGSRAANVRRPPPQDHPAPDIPRRPRRRRPGGERVRKLRRRPRLHGMGARRARPTRRHRAALHRGRPHRADARRRDAARRPRHRHPRFPRRPGGRAAAYAPGRGAVRVRGVLERVVRPLGREAPQNAPPRAPPRPWRRSSRTAGRSASIRRTAAPTSACGPVPTTPTTSSSPPSRVTTPTRPSPNTAR